MRLTPALEFEKLRKDPESWNKIFLHKDGKFFRAYEWSAWLIKTVVCTEEMQKERGDQKMLTNDADAVYRSVNSFLGVLCHHKTYHIRRAMFLKKKFMKVSTFNKDMTVFSKPTAQISL